MIAQTPAIVEDTAAIAVVEELRLRQPDVGGVHRREVGRHPHEALRIRVRQRPQDDGVHDGEDGAVGADAERKGRDRDAGKPRRAPEPAPGEPQVLSERGQHMDGRTRKPQASPVIHSRERHFRGRNAADDGRKTLPLPGRRCAKADIAGVGPGSQRHVSPVHSVKDSSGMRFGLRPPRHGPACRQRNDARILIADDQPDLLDALRLLLKGQGIEFDAVTSPEAAAGRAAVARLRSRADGSQLHRRHDVGP